MKKKILIIVLICFVFSPLRKVLSNDVPPDFTLKSFEGDHLTLSQFLGSKNVLINFWASWCDSCEEEIPILMKLKQRYAGQDIVFIAINVGDKVEVAKRFVERMGFDYKILLDQDKSVTKQFKIFGIPQTWVIGKNGEVLFHDTRPPKDIPLK